MKLIWKLTALLMAVVILCAPALAEETGNEPMSFEEFLSVATAADLLHLRDELDAAIRASDVWESVTVPSGLYQVGVDIPAGKWTLSPGDRMGYFLSIGDTLTDTQKEVDTFGSESSYFATHVVSDYEDVPILQSCLEIVDLPSGFYVEIGFGRVNFTTYYGKPNFFFYAEEAPSEEIMHEFPLDGLAYDELIVLKDQINLAIWNSYAWDRVLVPKGLYEIGIDIPAGYWDIEPPEASFVSVGYGGKLGEDFMNLWLDITAWRNVLASEQYSYYSEGDVSKTDIYAEPGFYFCIDSGVYAWFTPHGTTGSLGFKAFGGGTGTGNGNVATSAPTVSDSDTVTHDGEEYTRLDYEENARNPLLYTDKKIFFSGKIIQVVDGDYYTIYRVDVKGDVVLVYRFGSSSVGRFLVDDRVTVYGTSLGVETYESVLGGMITVPSCYAKDIVLNS